VPDLVLFDDAIAAAWLPFTLTRPAGELRFGALRPAERAARSLDARCVGHLAAARLRGFDEPGAAPVLAASDLPTERDLVFLSSRVVLELTAQPLPETREPLLLTVDGRAAGWYAPANTPHPDATFFADPDGHAQAGMKRHELAGRLLVGVWELVTGTPEQTGRDILALFPDAARPALPGVHFLGDGAVVLGDGVEVEPTVVLDTREGPIWLDDGVTVRALTRLSGPAYVGRDTTVLGGCLGGVSIGAVCKVHGEIEACVILDYSNKAHVGFLGHAYVGAWVNLGASTNNSDLKNNYGSVELWTPAGEVDTGETKLGSLIGDHVKTGIGTLLNTGTVIGAGSSIYGTELPPKHVTPFSWGTGAELVAYDLEKFLETARAVMERRDVALTSGAEQVLRAAWAEGRREQ
jgi:UDP-N-acetylglucosamine diphosphorylase / glucose-1-phosphate thymidylyltransferase / UDP-N-acetylgalactosamine diphosphorylase / glucosamine-1-phosphate N-acetyltransferase / galactosamine-1-phosphate N-acetyltransferase